MDPKAEVEFAGATKAIVTMEGKELAKITGLLQCLSRRMPH